jgi:polyhydroxyalkanoate synthesis regulator phasin
MAKRKNTLTKFLQDVVDDSKDLVDDLLDRVKDVEENARDAVKDVVDDDEKVSGSTAEIRELKEAIAKLTSEVNQLAKQSA